MPIPAIWLSPERSFSQNLVQRTRLLRSSHWRPHPFGQDETFTPSKRIRNERLLTDLAAVVQASPDAAVRPPLQTLSSNRPVTTNFPSESKSGTGVFDGCHGLRADLLKAWLFLSPQFSGDQAVVPKGLVVR